MKKINAILMAALCIAAASCTQEMNIREDIVPAGMKKVTFEVNNAAAKATLTETLGFAWADNDSLAVFDGTQINKFKIVSHSGNSATISGTVSEETTHVTVVYPFGAASIVSEELVVSVPNNQVIPAGGNIDPAALVCEGEADLGNAVAMSQKTALFKFSISTAVNNIRIVGRSVEGNFQANITAKEGKLAAGSYFTTVEARPYDQGLYACAYDDSKGYAKDAENPAFLSEGGSLNLGDITAKVAFPFEITNTDEFLAFLKYAGPMSKDAEITLANDLDFGKTTIAAGDNFHSQFDGKNHKIYNFSVEKTTDFTSLFGNVTTGATIKNLILGSANGTDYDGYSYVKYMASANPRVGLIAAKTDGATVENITSFVPVTVETNLTGASIGGLIGNATNSTVRNCKNSGAVSYDGTKVTGELALGGIAGICNNSNFIDNVSTSNITSKNTTSTVNVNLSGHVGKANGNGMYCKGCTYSGNIAFKTTDNANKNYSIGGIVGGGKKDESDYIVENCSSEGSVTIESALTNWGQMGGIAGGLSSNNDKGVQIKNCTSGMNFTITSANKSRIGGIIGLSQCAKSEYTDCTYSGSFTNNDGTNNFDRNFGGVIGQANQGAVTIKNCTFSGSAGTVNKGKNRFGGMCGQLDIANSEMTGCKTTSGCSIQIFPSGIGSGMILGHSTVASKVNNCKIAGTITHKTGNNASETVVITASNIADWMFAGSASTGAATLSNNGFNNE